MVTGYFWLNDRPMAGDRAAFAALCARQTAGRQSAGDQRDHSGHPVRLPVVGRSAGIRPRNALYNRFARWGGARHLGSCVRGIGSHRRPAGRALLDSTHIKVHRSASTGGERGDSRAIGPSRGGRNSKIHLIADAHGRPNVIALTSGQRNDSVPARGMLAKLPPICE
jgi:hypothetical protein